MEHFKVGIIGMGLVASSAIDYANKHYPHLVKFYSLMDSTYAIRKEDGSPFSQNDLDVIKNVKRKVPKGSLDESPNIAYNFSVSRVPTSKEKADYIRQYLDNLDVIIDASSAKKLDSFEISMAILSSTNLCTANKQAWKEHSYALKMIRTARKNCVHIGLNCTAGVWVNQFEYFPVALSGLKCGKLILRKRDNASLNTFLKLVREGYRAREAVHILFQKGYLEPEGSLTPSEVLDQEYKVLIPATIASNILGDMQVVKESKLEIVYPEGLDEIYSCTPEDIADWALEVEKKDKRAVVISKIVCDLEEKKITQQLAFRGLPFEDLMSAELDGESAICIDLDGSEKLVWDIVNRELQLHTNKIKEYIFNSGTGAGAATGEKLIEEAVRICNLRREIKRLGKPYVSYLPSLQDISTLPDQANILINEILSKKRAGPNLRPMK